MSAPSTTLQESSSPITVIPVPTSIPVFIGYTEQAETDGRSCFNELVPLQSMTDYTAIFGSGPSPVFTLQQATDSSEAGYETVLATINYRLYSGLLNFFANNGSSCYVISIGTYDATQSVLSDPAPFISALQLLETASGPTLIVIPDAVELKNATATSYAERYAPCFALQSAVLNHCAAVKNRFALIDIPEGYNQPTTESIAQQTTDFRNGLHALPDAFGYGAAYYPWLLTNVIPDSAIDYRNLSADSFPILQELLRRDISRLTGTLTPLAATLIDDFTPENTDTPEMTEAAHYFLQNSPVYVSVMQSMLHDIALVPPAAAVAGIYTFVDSSRGVWIAPANVGFSTVTDVGIHLTDVQQSTLLNTPPDGKAICGIRVFPASGPVVWGARTLDGNSDDWRYIQVRRTVIYIEQSIQTALESCVFLANNSQTWNAVNAMISHFLEGLWEQGGLFGIAPSDAFNVAVGMGSTMTAEDVQNGLLRIEVKVCLQHPAEFIALEFEQQLQV